MISFAVQSLFAGVMLTTMGAGFPEGLDINPPGAASAHMHMHNVITIAKQIANTFFILNSILSMNDYLFLGELGISILVDLPYVILAKFLFDHFKRLADFRRSRSGIVTVGTDKVNIAISQKGHCSSP